MRKAPILTQGGKVFIYFGDTLRKKMNLAHRLRNCYVVEYTVDQQRRKDGNIIFPQQKQICNKKEPYSGCGLALPRDDKHIISRIDFNFLRLIADDESIELYAKECGYNINEFKKAIQPFRQSLP